jgi:uncharacterized repeat protein (TIGR01451 family)
MEHSMARATMRLATVGFAVILMLPGAAGAVHAQRAAAEAEPIPRPLVMTAVNLTAAAEAEAGKPRPDSLKVELPGDVLEYRLVFTNTTEGEVRNVVFSNPLPGGLVYVLESASSDRQAVAVEFSIDGAESWSARPTIEVLDEAGNRVRRPAPPERYTHVRWTLTGGVAPGARVQASYRTLVATAAARP